MAFANRGWPQEKWFWRKQTRGNEFENRFSRVGIRFRASRCRGTGQQAGGASRSGTSNAFREFSVPLPGQIAALVECPVRDNIKIARRFKAGYANGKGGSPLREERNRWHRLTDSSGVLTASCAERKRSNARTRFGELAELIYFCVPLRPLRLGVQFPQLSTALLR